MLRTAIKIGTVIHLESAQDKMVDEELAGAILEVI